ncbi:MAG TPA: DUF397 domain-containing protein [Pseudonocardia sp.]
MDLSDATWRKSSFSTGNSDGESCVEVAVLPGGSVAVRDTKDRSRPAHRYAVAEWARFLAAVRSGELGRPA